MGQGDITFRASTTTETMFGQTEERDVERKPEGEGIPANIEFEESKPIEDMQVEVLDSFGVGRDTDILSTEDRDNLKDVSEHIRNLLRAKGLQPTRKSFTDIMSILKDEMGIESDIEPNKALDRMAGVVRAWRELSFIRDPHTKRSVLMKLARLGSSREMNRVVLEEMENRQIWL